jgi:hypothetical protein
MVCAFIDRRPPGVLAKYVYKLYTGVVRKPEKNLN